MWVDYTSNFVQNIIKSIVGKFLCCGRDTVAPSREGEKKEDSDKPAPPAGPSVKESLLSLKYLSICVYCVILQTRMNSIPGWTYTWLQWALGKGNNLMNSVQKTYVIFQTDRTMSVCVWIFSVSCSSPRYLYHQFLQWSSKPVRLRLVQLPRVKSMVLHFCLSSQRLWVWSIVFKCVSMRASEIV